MPRGFAPTAAFSNVYASVVEQCSTILGRRHAVIQIGRPRSAIRFGQVVGGACCRFILADDEKSAVTSYSGEYGGWKTVDAVKRVHGKDMGISNQSETR
jgi:hypothetical protein